MNKRRTIEFMAWVTILFVMAAAVVYSATRRLPSSLEHHALSDSALGRILEANR